MTAQVEKDVPSFVADQHDHDGAPDQFTFPVRFIRVGQDRVLQEDVLIHQEISVVQNINLHLRFLSSACAGTDPNSV